LPILKILTTYINETQIDVQAAIVYDQKTGIQTSYEHLYIVRNNVFGNDEIDSPDNIQPYDPCSSNPCYNGGTCVLGFAKSFSCYCLPEFNGKIIWIKFNERS
jgi:hypothetical protein